MTPLADTALRLASAAQLAAFHDVQANTAYAGFPVPEEEIYTGFAELDAHPSRSGDKTLTWALVDAKEPDGQVLAYARTIRRVVLARKPKEEITRETMYSIQSVVTPPEYRRRGYARHLLRTLHYVMAAEGALPPASDVAPILDIAQARAVTPPALASVLSSDLAPGWYEACSIGEGDGRRDGWVSESNHANSDLFFPVDVALSLPLNNEWHREWVFQSDLEAMRPALTASFEARLAAEPDDNVTKIIADPGAEGWVSHFEVFTRIRPSRLMRQATPADQPVGVRFSRSPGPYTAGDPLALFVPGAFFRDPLNMPLSMVSHLPPELVGTVLRLISPFAPPKGHTHIRAWGIDKTDPVAQEWVRLGGRVDDKMLTRMYPYGLAWYGEGAGDLLGCEMWAFT